MRTRRSAADFSAGPGECEHGGESDGHREEEIEGRKRGFAFVSDVSSRRGRQTDFSAILLQTWKEEGNGDMRMEDEETDVSLTCGANSVPSQVAGAIAGKIREGYSVSIRACGAKAVSKTVSAVTFAKMFLADTERIHRVRTVGESRGYFVRSGVSTRSRLGATDKRGRFCCYD